MSSQHIPSPADPDARVLYLTREGCHLCEEALPVVRAEADRAGTAVEVRDIDEDERLRTDWDHDVPVIIVDGKVHARYRVESEQLRRAAPSPLVASPHRPRLNGPERLRPRRGPTGRTCESPHRRVGALQVRRRSLLVAAR